jgi:hypothetical protein
MEDEPFPILMQTLGFFSCRTEAWLGLNPDFRGVGGEEFYVHEKFRQAGRQCWCLPWLRWLPRSARSQGNSHPDELEDRVRNYLLGWKELGLPLEPIYTHFMHQMSGARLAQVASEALGRLLRVTVEEVKDLNTPFVPTHPCLVDKMLEVAQLTEKDVVYDLGCGDGRIVCTAAERYGCKAIGFDVDPVRLAESANTRMKLSKKVQQLVTFKKQDLLQVDLSEATAIVSYLMPEVNVKLVPQLRTLRPGARVVFHDYDIQGIPPDEGYPIALPLPNDRDHLIFRYTTPLMPPQDESVHPTSEPSSP